MNRILCWCVLFGIGLQVSTAVASEFGSLLPLQAKLPTQSQSPSCCGGRRPLAPHTTSTTNPPRFALFATSQSAMFSTRKSGSNLQKSVSTENSILSRHRFMPPSHAPRTPTRKLFMLTPENRELISTIASLSFWPDVSYINEVVSWIIGFSVVFVGASLLASKPNTDQQQQQLAFVATGANAIANETNNNEDDVLLTPETYADSNSAERLVTDTVVARASEAFDSTDFENEPHLSPELEDVEAAFEVALLANAAHAMADAAEKENRQSKAAMLERERELEWIERHGEGGSNVGMIMPSSSKEKFQRSLLAAQLANKSTLRAKKQEAFQRSLLSSRIAYDIKSKENIAGQQRHEEAMEPECSSVSERVIGDLEAVENEQFGVDSVQETHFDGNNENMVGMDDIAAHTSESDESIVLGDDASENIQRTEESIDTEAASFENDNNAQLVAQEVSTMSIIDQSRKDSVQAVRKYIHQKAIEKTKQKMMLRNNIDGGEIVAANNVESIDTATDDQSDEISVKELANNSSSGMKLFNKRALIRRMPRRRRLLVVALGLVITRRLFLAYFGNALSMI